MAEAVLNWTTIMEAIQDELEAVLNAAGTAAFAQVFIGEPIGLPVGGPYACAWYLGRTLATSAGGSYETMGNVMYAARIQVLCLWPMQPERATLESWEADIATIDTNIRRAFHANRTINSNITDLRILDSDNGYGDLPASHAAGAPRNLYRVLQMELRLDNLEGEAIAP